jgi:hypothetical protein
MRSILITLTLPLFFSCITAPKVPTRGWNDVPENFNEQTTRSAADSLRNTQYNGHSPVLDNKGYYRPVQVLPTPSQRP